MGNGDNRGRDQGWGSEGRGAGDDRWRRDEQRQAGQGRGPEDRSFEQRGGRHEGGEPWRGESRYGARYDQERTGYQNRSGGGVPGGYAGQEYGMEGGPDHRTTSDRDRGWRGDEREAGRRGGDQREQWRPDGGAPYGDLELNPRNSGIQEFGAPHDYAYHPKAGHEFDPDYLHWREQQMRSHDRDYQEWRQTQQKSYDDDYHRFRSERREHFGRNFSDWRSQRTSVGGVPDQTAAMGVSGYGEHTGTPTGYGANQSSKPSGMLETGGMNASAGAGQSGGGGGGAQSASTGGGDKTPEFGREPSQVKAAADGWDGRGSAHDHVKSEQAMDESRETKDAGDKH